MTTKIFKSILITAFIVFTVAFVTAYGFAKEYIAAEIILLIIMLVTVAAFFIARALSSAIVKPISEIDPDRPERAMVYEELRPVISKLASQNYRVARQMEELKIRENEFLSITSNMSEGMIVINSRAEILSANQSAKELMGFVGEVPRSILNIRIPEGLRDAIGAALSGNNGYYETARGDKHYSVIVTPVERDGITDGAVIVIIDDTEKEHREALRREFTSNVSHELKTPLTSISGFAELIKCGMAEGDEAKHFAENIHKEASRLITLVGDIIRLTQLDGREIPYDGEIDLHEVASEVAERLSGIAESKDITLTVEGASAPVLGTYQILEEMIYNLVDNAIKYNYPGGRVEIILDRVGTAASVTVRDNGIGIPADKQDRVFERFYRVDKSHSKEIGGTGLGLSIVKHAALFHKAKISLESTEGKGTSVIIKFPAVLSDG